MNEIVLNKQYFELKPTGLIINGQPTFDEWEQAGGVLKYIEGSVHWWLGDWLNYGEQTYGEMYSQALDATDYTEGTLRNDKFMSKAFELSCRHDNLPFSFHQEVVTLMKRAQGLRTDLTSTHDGSKSFKQQLKEIPMPLITAQRWSLEHSLPWEDIEAYAAEIREVKELTSADIIRMARKEEEIETPPLPEGKYRVIYADPPWQYSNAGLGGAAERHYATGGKGALFCVAPFKCFRPRKSRWGF